MSVSTHLKWILIVDDEKRVTSSLEETLKAMGKGLAVVSVGSAEEALDEMARRPFDLLVTDLRMPGMDGLELMRRAKAIYPQTRAILITAYGSEEVEEEVRRLQPALYLTKPFLVGDFAQAVERALEMEPAPVQEDSSPPLSGQIDAVHRALTALRRDTGAQCAMLADPEGRLIAQVGAADDLPLEEFLPILAEEVSISNRVGSLIGEGPGVSLHHYEGKRYQLYTAILPDTFLLTVLSRQPSPRRFGTAWLFLRRALRELRALMPTGYVKGETEP